MNTGENHQWHSAPGWKKRLHGLIGAAIYVVWILINPDSADRALYEVLRDQFDETE